MRSKVSEQGRVTIPKGLRDQLGIRAGDELVLTTDGDRLIALKASKDDPVWAVTGIVSAQIDVLTYLEDLRGKSEE